MPIRSAVSALVKLGRLPRSDAPEEEIARYELALARISPPVTAEEAGELLLCFGEDDCFGLAWTLLHLVESNTGPSPLQEAPGADANEWLRRLWDRSQRA